MRLYFKKKPIHLNLKQFKPVDITEKKIFTNEGIYEIRDNKFYNLDILDKEIEELIVDNNDLILDNSEINLVQCFRIPNFFIEKTIKKSIYTLEDINLVIEKETDLQDEIYFEIKDKTDLEKLSTFLSAIK